MCVSVEESAPSSRVSARAFVLRGEFLYIYFFLALVTSMEFTGHQSERECGAHNVLSLL